MPHTHTRIHIAAPKQIRTRDTRTHQHTRTHILTRTRTCTLLTPFPPFYTPTHTHTHAHTHTHTHAHTHTHTRTPFTPSHKHRKREREGERKMVRQSTLVVCASCCQHVVARRVVRSLCLPIFLFREKCMSCYGVATISRLPKIIRLFCRISSLL